MADDPLAPEEVAIQLREEIDRGYRSEALLTTLRETISALRDKTIETFEQSNPHDHDGHTMLSLYLRVLRDIEDKLESYIGTGKVANDKLLRMAKPESRVKRAIRSAI